MKNLARAALFAAVTFFAFASAQANYLYWQVDFSDDEAAENNPWKSTDGDPYVWMVAVDSEGNRQTLTGHDKAGNDTTHVLMEKNKTGYLTMVISVDNLSGLSPSADSYTFFVEMGNYIDGTENAKYESVHLTYSDLKTGKYLSTSDTFQNMTVWNPGLDGFTQVVPEPTGGMLFGFGLCVLALRRKRKRGAA